MSLERRINSVYIKSGLWLRGSLQKQAETQDPIASYIAARDQAARTPQPRQYGKSLNTYIGAPVPKPPSELSSGQRALRRLAIDVSNAARGTYKGVRTLGGGMYDGSRIMGKGFYNGIRTMLEGVHDGAKTMGEGANEGAETIRDSLLNGDKPEDRRL